MKRAKSKMASPRFGGLIVTAFLCAAGLQAAGYAMQGSVRGSLLTAFLELPVLLPMSPPPGVTSPYSLIAVPAPLTNSPSVHTVDWFSPTPTDTLPTPQSFTKIPIPQASPAEERSWLQILQELFSNYPVVDDAQPAADDSEPGTMTDDTDEFDADEPVSFTDEPNPAPAPVCGNGQVEPGEYCDRQNLNGETCVSYGPRFGVSYAGGTLRCSSSCRLFDTSECTRCGNGIVESFLGEVCDGNNFNGQDCRTLNNYSGEFGWGDLRCNADCRSVNTDHCERFRCGNGQIDSGERCDVGHLASGFPQHLNGQTCQSLGFAGGMLSCNAFCWFNFSQCIQPAAPVCLPSSRPEIVNDCLLSGLSCCTGYGCGRDGCEPCDSDDTNCFRSSSSVSANLCQPVGEGCARDPCCAGLNCVENRTYGTWTCQSGTPPPLTCNRPGQPCCANDQCQGGLQCTNGTCQQPAPPPPTPRCDRIGDPCCGTPPSVCTGQELECRNGRCAHCGGNGENCCGPAPGRCNSTRSLCVDNPVLNSGRPMCVACGGANELCCTNPRCSTEFDCQTSPLGEQRCRACGGPGQACCNSGTQCLDPNAPSCRAAAPGASQTCQPACGAEGEQCCGGNSCIQQEGQSLHCILPAAGAQLRCALCGNSGQACCGQNSCSGTLQCVNQLCQSQCGGPGEPCCSGQVRCNDAATLRCNAPNLTAPGFCVSTATNNCMTDGQLCSNVGCCPDLDSSGRRLVCDIFQMYGGQRCRRQQTPPPICERRSAIDEVRGSCTGFGNPGNSVLDPRRRCTTCSSGQTNAYGGSCNCTPSTLPLCSGASRNPSSDVSICSANPNCPADTTCGGNLIEGGGTQKSTWGCGFLWRLPCYNDRVDCACR